MSCESRIDLDEANNNFHLIDESRLYRTNGRFAGEVESKSVRMNNTRHKTLRVIYALMNQVELFGPVMLNDNNEPVEVSYNFLAMMAHKNDYGSIETVWSKSGHRDSYLARYTDMNGNRPSKTFKSLSEAREWVKDMTLNSWGKYLEDKNMINKYTEGL